MTKCTLTPDSGGIAVKTPYDADWVAEFKSLIPNGERKPQFNGKKFIGWIVTPQHGITVQKLCEKYFNELPLLPQLANVKPIIKQRILDVRYIGVTKNRGADERSAYGWYQDGWNVIFTETVLRGWFEGGVAMPDQAATLYSVLAVGRNATTDEIKSGYRRMVFQWHPDRCKEPNAQEQFLTVQHAYDILSKNRERYDAGLALEASLKNTPKDHYSEIKIAVNGYRSPLRCGLIMCEGTDAMGIFNVSKIFAWQDITDRHGRVLVVSWSRDAKHFEEMWA